MEGFKNARYEDIFTRRHFPYCPDQALGVIYRIQVQREHSMQIYKEIPNGVVRAAGMMAPRLNTKTSRIYVDNDATASKESSANLHGTSCH